MRLRDEAGRLVLRQPGLAHDLDRDVPVEVRFRGQERQLRFEVFAVGFAEPDGSGANNGANWPAVS